MSRLEAVWFDLHRLEWMEKVTLLCLQGLVNRRGPRLMFETRFWNWSGADAYWRRYYEDNKGIVFTTLDTPDDVVRRFAGELDGIVLYDPDLEQTLWVAATMGGLNNCVPMSPEQARRFGELPVRYDLRGRWRDKLGPIRWAMDELLPKCRRGVAYSVDKLWSGVSVDSLDYAILEQGFVFSLKPDAEGDEGRLAHDLMDALGPNCGVYGWAEPEHRYCELVSLHSNYIMCAEAPNLSFHHGVPAETARFRQKARLDRSKLRLERDKYYVAFMTSEGDAMKIHTVLHGQAWLNPDRGKVPINWGFQPRMLEVAPAMAEYYYGTATPNDYFYCGCSGAGYTYPNWMPEPQPFFEASNEYMKRADLRILDTWIHFHRPTYELYLQQDGIDCITMPCGPGGPVWMANGKAVLRRYPGLHYYPPGRKPEEIVESIRQATKYVRSKPGFMTFFFVPDWQNASSQGGYSPTDLVSVRDGLGGEFKVVTLEEMAWAMYAAGR